MLLATGWPGRQTTSIQSPALAFLYYRRLDLLSALYAGSSASSGAIATLTNRKRSGRDDTVLLLEKYGAARSFGGPPLSSKALTFKKGKSMSNCWLQLAQEALKVPGLLIEIYGDLARPGVRQVGKALDTVLGLGNTILWPIALANERSRIYLEKNLENFRSRLERVPEEKIVSVTPEIGVPIAEKLAYVRDDGLAELYITLLAKASNEDSVSQAHPSFVNIINSLSPDEAQLLEFFVSNDNIEFVCARWQGPNVYSIAGDLLVSPDLLKSLTFPMNAPAYICNLAGLGLILVHHDRIVYESKTYEALEEYWSKQLTIDGVPEPERKLEIDGGVITLTKFGHQFIGACHQRE